MHPLVYKRLERVKGPGNMSNGKDFVFFFSKFYKSPFKGLEDGLMHFALTTDVLESTIRKENEIQGMKNGKKEVNFLYSQTIQSDLRSSQPNYSRELINEFSNISE